MDANTLQLSLNWLANEPIREHTSAFLENPLGGSCEMPITPFLHGRAFDHETVRLLGKAFEAVCKELHDVGQPDVVREVITTRIVDVAMRGERDPEQLCAAVLKDFFPRR